jgi:SMC interacting uncharacterized protein involved in chromosome segregation
MMELSSANIAVVISLVSNCVAILFLIFMLFRILSETSHGHRLVRDGSEKLIKAGEELSTIVATADAMVLRMRGVAAGAGEGGHHRTIVNQGSLMISPEGIKILSRLMQSLSQHTLNEMQGVLLEMRQLLASLNAISPEGYPAWQQANQATINKILGVAGISPEVLVTIQSNIEDSKLVTQELERSAREANGQILSVDELSAHMRQQETLVEQMRDRAQKAEERAEMLNHQIHSLSEMDQSRKSDSKELERLRNQNNQLSQERSSLVRHLETLTSEIKRTKLEKEFIEDRLLSMVDQSKISEAETANA